MSKRANWHLLQRGIVKRKQTRKAYYERQNILKGIFDNTEVICFLVEVTPDGEYVYRQVNAAFERQIGLSANDLCGKTLEEFYPEDKYNTREFIRSNYKRLLESGQTITFEEMVPFCGKEYWWLTQLSPLRDRKGRISHILGIVTPISDRKEYEEKLRQSEERFRSLFNDSPIPVWVEDFSEIKKRLEEIKASGVKDLKEYFSKRPELLQQCLRSIRLVDANQAAVNVYHLSSLEELLEKFSILYNPEVTENTLDEIICISNNKREFEGIAVNHKPDGERMFLNFKWVVAPGCETSYKKVFVSVIDITQRIKAEEDLRKSEERYHRLFENAVLGIFRSSLDGKNIEVNPAHARMFGYESPEEELSLAADIAHTLYADAGQFAKTLEKTLSSLTPIRSEILYRRKDGSLFNGIVHAWKVKDAAGNPLYIEGFIEDITHHKQTEALLERRFKEQMVLYAIASASTETSSEDALIAEATRIVTETFDYNDFGVLLLNEQDQTLYIHPSFHTTLPVEKWVKRVPLGKGITGRVAKTGKPIRCGNISQSNDYIVSHPNTRSELCVPIKVGGRVLGVIDSESPQENHFSESDERFITAVADQLATAITRVRLLKSLEEKIFERSRHLNALSEISAIASQPVELPQMLKASLEATLQAIHAKGGSIYLSQEETCHLEQRAKSGYIPESPVCIKYQKKIIKSGQMLYVPSLAPDTSPPASYLGIPICSKGKCVGVMSFFSHENHLYAEGDLALLDTIGKQIGAAVENALLRKQNEEIALMEERNRVARELHDAVTQSLYSASLIAKGAYHIAVEHQDTQLINYLKELGDISQQALKEMRQLIYELRPSTLATDGLEQALRKRLAFVEQHTGTEVKVQFDPSISLPLRIESGLYRIAQEALNNILKHSEATWVSVRLYRENRHIFLEIRDNGKGFNPKQQGGGGIGLQSMRERAANIEAQIFIQSRPGKGTRLLIRLPEDKR
ncbi:MAG: PAS domain S-box protein [Anaerolineae bacterium]|nr:PAS domain S-box protein [Anaerolineae bacterium]